MIVKKLFPILCNSQQGHESNFIQTIFSISSLFFSTKQMRFPSLNFSTIPTKHKCGKLKSLLSSHFSILYLFSILQLFHLSNQTDSQTVFGRVDFREDGKKMRRKNFLNGVWLGRVEGKEMVGPKCFFLEHTKKFSPRNGGKIGGWGRGDKSSM